MFKSISEIKKHSQSVIEHFHKQWHLKNIETYKKQLQQLTEKIQDPNFWNDTNLARSISQQKSECEKKITPWQKLQSRLNDFPTLLELTKDEMKTEQALLSLSEEIQEIERSFHDLMMVAALDGVDDRRNAILSITPGAGGTESQDWAEILLRMYYRWCERKKYSYKILDLQMGEEAGIKSASILIKGENAYGFLSCENGVHRLVRLSPFDANKKRHTSFASVYVSPEIDEDVEIEVAEKDLRIDTYRASGAGGQHVNKTDSAIRITHIPSKIVIQCQSERSQYSNRKQAMQILRARLYELEKQRKQQNLQERAGEKLDVTWGNQIRSYVLHPYKMVKDLRTEYETSNTEAVLNGDIDDFINSYLKTKTTV